MCGGIRDVDAVATIGCDPEDQFADDEGFEVVVREERESPPVWFPGLLNDNADSV